ncbi:MAG: extracellular solute-binding protein [Simkaniaceae bacterium]|nr:extracellular solute-binding protein [Simkaniaceae bacterium]
MGYFIKSIISILWAGAFFSVLYLSGISFTKKTEDNAINIFTWGGLFTEEIIHAFEEKTGIKVNVNYYTSNEELIVKLKATSGKGYDLILPSDYAVKILKENNLLQKIDPSKVLNYQNIHPILLNQEHDITSEYSIPFVWEVYGFGIDQERFMKKPFMSTWDQIFDPSLINYRIAMLNDPIEAVNLAAYYLFGPTLELSEPQTNNVKELLINQKPYVEAYASLRSDYLLATKNCAVAVSPSSYIFRAASQFPNIQFVLPKKWSFITVESFAIPKHSKKQDLIYAFINFVLEPENYAKLIEKYHLFPAIGNVFPYLNMPKEFEEVYHSTSSASHKFYYFKPLLKEKETRNLWVEVKS